MANYITIDGGTTNTRIRLLKDGNVTEEILLPTGAGDGKDKLSSAIKEGLSKLSEIDVAECIIASGMLTSEFGICPLEHIKVPAGIEELHNSMEKVHLPDISDKAFYFIRGVKTAGGDFSDIDMMRGEETELAGLSDELRENCIYVLPGSHSKVIETDTRGRITDFSTMLTGEMIAALSGDTILKSAFDLKTAALDEEYLQKGFAYCKSCGINKGLFKVRVIRNMLSESADRAYSFFMGVLLCGEITEIIRKNPKSVILGGREQIKNAMCILLENNSDCEIIQIPNERASIASSLGMVKIFEYGA